MGSKKLTPPSWDKAGKRWRKVAYCNGMSRVFSSTKKSRNTAEKEIMAAINTWKEQVNGLSALNGLSPMSRVQDVYREYKVDLEIRTGKSNWRPAESRFEHWVLPLIGKMSIIDINSGTIQRVINYAYKTGNLSKKSLNNIKTDLLAFIKFCRKNQLTNYRPEDISIPRGAASNEKKILQPEDLKVLFSVDTVLYRGDRIVDPYVYAFRLQVLHCLRPGEVGGLRKSDRIGNTVHLQRSINIVDEVTNGKNENAVRSFVLSEEGEKYWDALAKLSHSDYLLPDFNTKRYYDRLKRYCKSNDITQVTPYELRHTSFSLAQTLPEGLVKQMGGHSQNMDTFGIYGHVVDGDLQLTTDLMEQRLHELLA